MYFLAERLCGTWNDGFPCVGINVQQVFDAGNLRFGCVQRPHKPFEKASKRGNKRSFSQTLEIEQTMSSQRATSGEPEPVDHTGLCLLSLDGGGVRGLSMLYILKALMTQLNHEREGNGAPKLKPCEVFDLIGGISTGG